MFKPYGKQYTNIMLLKFLNPKVWCRMHYKILMHYHLCIYQINYFHIKVKLSCFGIPISQNYVGSNICYINILLRARCSISEAAQQSLLFSNLMTKQELGAHLWKSLLPVYVRLDEIVAVTFHLLKRIRLREAA